MRAAAPSLLALFAGLPAAVSACLNDRDTLIREVASPPGVLTALTGRFERLPPIYYQARVERLRRIARPMPEELDDLGVALDRLGRDDEALAAMARKAAIPDLGREARYRLHANRGTFLAHRALATRAPASALRPAIADIAEAIRLKPDAHFGREGVQLRVLQWIYAHRTDPKTQSLGIVLSREGDPAKTATALAGLVELGGAWESPDVVAAIGHLMPDHDQAGSISGAGGHGVNSYRRSAVYVRLRYAELKAAGRRPLDLDAETHQGRGDGEVPEPERGEIARQWRAERDAAEFRTARRAEYVERRIAAGRHPDTDPAFDAEWREPPLPIIARLPDRIELGPERRDELARTNRLLAAALALVVSLVALVVYVGVRIARRARPA